MPRRKDLNRRDRGEKNVNAKAQRRKDAKKIPLIVGVPSPASFTQAGRVEGKKQGTCFAPLRLCVFALMLFVFLSACIPAETPAILDATPGDPAQVFSWRVITSAFSMNYPIGWRAILSPADQPPFVTTAAPDNCVVIIVSVEPVESPALRDDCGERVTQTAEAALDGDTIYLSGASHDAEMLRQTLIMIQESLTPP